jgi:hypothetical protein
VRALSCRIKADEDGDCRLEVAGYPSPSSYFIFNGVAHNAVQLRGAMRQVPKKVTEVCTGVVLDVV